MTLTVIPLREGPLLTDIVAHLRNLADRVEAGEYGEVDAVFAVMPRAGDYPKIFGWGNTSGPNDATVQLELAKLWLLTRMVERQS